MKVTLVFGCLIAVIAGVVAEQAAREVAKRFVYPGYPSSESSISSLQTGSNVEAANSNDDKFLHIKANRQQYPGMVGGWGTYPDQGLGGMWNQPSGLGTYPGIGGAVYPGAEGGMHGLGGGFINPAIYPPLGGSIGGGVYPGAGIGFPGPTAVYPPLGGGLPGGIGGVYPGAGVTFPSQVYPPFGGSTGGVYPGAGVTFPGAVYPGIGVGGGYPMPYGGANGESLEAIQAASKSQSAYKSSDYLKALNAHNVNQDGGYPGYPGMNPFMYRSQPI